MSCYNGLPKILTKKNTGIMEVIIFVIQYCLLLDTSCLFVNEKLPLNKEIKKKVVNGGERNGFDLIEFFSINNNSQIMVGGAIEQVQQLKITKKEGEDLIKENEQASKELSDAREAEKRFQIKDQKKEEIRKENSTDQSKVRCMSLLNYLC